MITVRITDLAVERNVVFRWVCSEIAWKGCYTNECPLMGHQCESRIGIVQTGNYNRMGTEH